MKTKVIYHRADFDGIFCREIARKFLPDAELIGWDHGDAPVELTDCQKLYVMDLPLDGPLGFKWDREVHSQHFFPGDVVWIDHHKSSIESHPTSIPGYRIDGVAACRLAWQWFTDNSISEAGKHSPPKEAFVERRVIEPLAVRLAGEYDVWDKRDPDAELFQHGLRSRDLTNEWSLLLTLDRKMSVSEIEALIDCGHHKDLCRPDGTTPNPLVLGLLEAGRGIQYAKTQENESIIKAAGFTIEFEGLKFLACNHARYNSYLFTAGLTPEHDGCFGFAWRDGHWNVSLYHAPGKEHHDLSQIAIKHGGGGHRGACGFRTNKLPFIP